MTKNNELKLFSRPLVLGASISAGYGTRDGGIGAVLARMINPDAKITNKAVSGATSVQSTAHLDFSLFTPSVVLGLDLFFWDAAREMANAKFEANTRRLFKEFKHVPMIIGKVPVIDLPLGPRLDSIKKSAHKVNNLLDELCTAHGRSLLYDPIHCFMSMDSGKYFSDGLHLNSEGNKFCANFLIQTGALKSVIV